MKRILLALVILAALFWRASAFAQAFPFHYLSAATTNSTLVTPGTSHVHLIVLINTTTSLYFLKLYDKVSAPTCNTDPVKFTIPVPFGASNAGGGAVIPIPDGMRFVNGFGFCLTGGSADNDNTNAATGVIINFAVKQQ